MVAKVFHNLFLFLHAIQELGLSFFFCCWTGGGKLITWLRHHMVPTGQ